MHGSRRHASRGIASDVGRQLTPSSSTSPAHLPLCLPLCLPRDFIPDATCLVLCQRETEDGTKVSLFSLFGLEKQKRRKRKLVDVLWFDRALAEASAEVVLSVFRDHLEARHAWVENKRDARIRADLLCTVQVSLRPPASRCVCVCVCNY